MVPGRQPFRPFFAVAALDAIFGAAIWTPALSWAQPWLGVSSVGEWHRHVLLYGAVPATMAGFLLTALPRWTGKAGPPHAVSKSLLALWLAAKGAFLFGPHGSGPALSAAFLIALTLTTAGCVIPASDRRNFKVVLLLTGLCASAVMAALSWRVDLSSRLALASLIGLLVVVGGRVIPALTTAYRWNSGSKADPGHHARVERSSAAATALALLAWTAAPDAQITAAACMACAFLQLARVAQWRGWNGRLPASIAALHLGYFWIGLGFMLLALHITFPAQISRAAAVHAWTVGALGTMSLGIMGSMIRRHGGLAFVPSVRASAAYVAITGAAVVRVGGEFIQSNDSLWLTLSGGLYLVAFLLFLAAFHQPLLGRG